MSDKTLSIADLEGVLEQIVQQYKDFMATPCPQGDAQKWSIGLQFIGGINFAQNLIGQLRGGTTQPISKTLGPTAPNLRG